ncbi:hypothetical protein [Rhodomicrobium sp.]|jgi:hypothetical protein|uniref:hypothetical protein n=1 Tax=Rhodomicrobium sp. TaxID=2720632 RepID=UPI0039E229F2
MSLVLNADVIALLEHPDTVRILATVDGQGVPHAVVKKSIHLGDDGNIHYLELLETSATNRNMVRSIWFDGTVAITLANPDGRSAQIKGRPVKAHITGPLFLHHYNRLKDIDADAELAAVWIIEPRLVLDQTFAARRDAERASHPHFAHLDRLRR